MTVREYIEGRPQFVYGKKIRILNGISKKYLGEWTEYADKYVIGVKITTKYIFIFI